MITLLNDADAAAEIAAAAARFNATPEHAEFIRQHFNVQTSDDRELLACKRCGRLVSYVEAFTVRSPELLLNHSVPGLPSCRCGGQQ